jgi:hypothetical protein
MVDVSTHTIQENGAAVMAAPENNAAAPDTRVGAYADAVAVPALTWKHRLLMSNIIGRIAGFWYEIHCKRMMVVFNEVFCDSEATKQHWSDPG